MLTWVKAKANIKYNQLEQETRLIGGALKTNIQQSDAYDFSFVGQDLE